MARKQKKYHYIYKTTCNITGRYYIGMHSTDNLDDGYIGSGKRLWHSFNKYGKENHVKEIIEFLSERELLRNREKEIVNEELLGDKMCMNLRIGGDGGFYSLEACTKGGLISGKLTADRFKNDKEFRDRMKKILVNNVKKAHKDGKFKYGTFKNKTHSEETKQLMSESSKGMGIGETNSQYGTCWITKDGINKKIKKENFGLYLKEGWIKGRKL